MAIVRIPFLTLSPHNVVPLDNGWSNGQNIDTSTVGVIITDGLISEFIRRANAAASFPRREYAGFIAVHHLLDPSAPLKRKLVWQSFMKIEHPATADALFCVGFFVALGGTGIGPTFNPVGVGFVCKSNAQSWKARIADSPDDVIRNIVLDADTGVSSASMHFLKFTIDGETAKVTFEIDGQVVAAHTMISALDKTENGLFFRYMTSPVSAENHGFIFHGGGGVVLYMEYESP